MMGDLLSASSLLLAVIGILYGFWYNDLHQAKRMQVPNHAANCTAPRIEVSRVLWSRALPLAASSVLLAVVFLPDAITIVSDSYNGYVKEGFSLASYDAVRTAFCVVVVFKVVLASHLSTILVQIISLRARLRRKEVSVD